MNNTNYINLSSQMALWRQIEIVANNVANVDTNGYQSERMNFKEYIKPLEFGRGRLSFVQTRNISRNPENGAIVTTGAPLDVAINGEGYFRIATPLGERLTRDGRFTIDKQGILVTHSGFPVLDRNGDQIAIPQNAEQIKIYGNGEINIDGNLITQFAVVTVPYPPALAKVSGNLYINTLEQELQPASASLIQGALERSNVNAIIEITKLIDAHRSFEAITDFINREDERQGKYVREKLGSDAGAS